VRERQLALPRAVVLKFFKYLRLDFQSLSFLTSPKGKTDRKTFGHVSSLTTCDYQPAT
jgi:hypothetical protein